MVNTRSVLLFFFTFLLLKCSVSRELLLWRNSLLDQSWLPGLSGARLAATMMHFVSLALSHAVVIKGGRVA